MREVPTMPDANATSRTCLLCGGGPLERIDDENLGCISSDLRILSVMSSALFCPDCGHLQKNIDASFHEKVLGIYDDGYHLPGGQVDVRGGTVLSRGEIVAASIQRSLQPPASGAMLDFGCGHGFFLRDFHTVFPDWDLYGYDITTDKLEELHAIEGVCRIFTGRIEAVNQRFDLITLNHVLEHLLQPVEVLLSLRKLLRPGGRMILRVPSYLELYSEFVIGDHVSLFTEHTLATAAALAGLTPAGQLADVSDRELVLVLTAGEPAVGVTPEARNRLRAKAVLDWLRSERNRVLGELARNRPFGVYGVSGMGAWLGSLAPETVDFFVDDNPAMDGLRLYGVEIVPPRRIPQGATVFVAFKQAIARGIRDRVRPLTPTVRYVCPEALEMPD